MGTDSTDSPLVAKLTKLSSARGERSPPRGTRASGTTLPSPEARMTSIQREGTVPGSCPSFSRNIAMYRCACKALVYLFVVTADRGDGGASERADLWVVAASPYLHWIGCG